MQSLSLFLTKHYLYYLSADFALESAFLEFDPLEVDPLQELSNLLSTLALPRSISINLVLDPSFINYYYFTLPPVNRRKIDKILEFELADTLINDADDYFYDYRTNLIKEIETHIGVYSIDKEMINRIIQIGKNIGIEIKSILSMDDLLDIKLREKYCPKNQLIVTADKTHFKVFAYKNSFLLGCSNVLINGNKPSDAKACEDPDSNAARLNRLIKSIQIRDNSLSNILVDDKVKSLINIDDEGSLTFSEPKEDVWPDSFCSELANPGVIARPNRVNLLKSNFFLFLELKKHSKKLIISGITLALCCIIYIGSLVFENSIKSKQFAELGVLYSQTINKYLPKGTAKSSAVMILKDQVQELKDLQKKNARFVKREYFVSRQINDLSSLKEKVASLVLSRYFLTDQSIRIQGEVASFAEYDLLKRNLEIIYPDNQYTTKFNQKSVGEDIIQFSATFRESK